MASLAPSIPDGDLAHLSPENRERVRRAFDLFDTTGFEPPAAPENPCDCEWGQNSYRNDAVAILDDHRECPFCRGQIGGETNR